MPAHLEQRADGVGAREAERSPALPGQRLGEEEPAVDEVDEAQDRRGVERRSRAEPAEQTAQRRTEDEADAERRAHEPEPLARSSGALTSAT